MPFIKVLVRSFPTVKRPELLLKRFPAYVTNDIVEILYNVVKGNIKMPHSKVNSLRRYKKSLLKLVNLPNKTRRQHFIYKQSGGFIGAVLPVIASLLGGIVS